MTSRFESYKNKVINKQKKKLEDYESMSGSRIFVDRILQNIGEIVIWGLIIYLVLYASIYGKPMEITCDRINKEFCFDCFEGGIINKINSMPTGLENLSDMMKIGEEDAIPTE